MNFLFRIKIKLLPPIVLLGFMAAAPFGGRAQNAPLASSQETDLVVDEICARSDRLEKSVATEIKRSGGDKQTLTCLEKTVLKALANEQQIVTNQTVFSLLDAWIILDTRDFPASKNGKVKSRAINYAQAKRFIEAVLPLTGNRIRLKFSLLQREGDLLIQENRLGDAAQKYGSAINSLYPSSNSRADVTDIMLLQKSLKLVDALHKPEYDKRAPALLLAILRYPFYTLPDEKSRASFDTIYIQAGRRLIAAYAGNLKRLKELSFRSSSLSELKPELVRAIIAAGGKAADGQAELPEGIDNIINVG